MVAERFGIHEQVAEMHSMLAEYHRELAKEARLDIVRDYHVDLAQRLADEATQIPRRAATLARFHELEKQVTRELGKADLTGPAAPLSR
jgi:2-oxo-4-hydroxy-4-carboxy--5-ureidoimidazoline (OHCU) decarboxylase